MQNRRKRKQPLLHPPPAPPSESPKPNSAYQKPTNDPYPNHPRPTPDECRSVRNDLLALHGFPKQFAKYRSYRPNLDPLPLLSSGSAQCPDKTEPLTDGGPVESVLDGLVSTILSQNTTDLNSQKAFASLKSDFPTWEDVLAAESKDLENAIRCGGLAPTKASCIKNLLSCLLEKKGKLCLEYLRELSVDEIKAELSQFKGIGPKTVSVTTYQRAPLGTWLLAMRVLGRVRCTQPYPCMRRRGFCVSIHDFQVACVLMFQLQQDDFPVDTHVFQISKAIGWVPERADTKKTYLHLNRRIPKELKFDLNCLLFTHGKLCQQCTKGGGNKQKRESNDNSCPLLNYCKISKSEFNS